MKQRLAPAGILAVGIAAVLVGATASMPAPAPASTGADRQPRAAGISPGSEFTTLAASVSTHPTPVRGTDGRVHIAYELLLTGMAPFPIDIERVEVRDGRSHRVLASLAGRTLSASMNPVGGVPEGAPPAATTTVARSATSIVWLDVSVPASERVPRVLEHRVVGSGRPPGGESVRVLSVVGRVPLARRPPIVLGPPVGSGTWVANEGCCTNPTHHRRGLIAVDGDLVVPQRFAIDWFLLDSRHRAWVGDPARLSSYFSYDQPLIAAADGTVVVARDGFRNYPPPHGPQPPPPIGETVGNHVTLRVGEGLYLLYAHMRPGSVRVRVGQRVRRGQVLGRLGNSGNSSTPHLHLQIQTTRTFFPTGSLPYVFDRFTLTGQITEPFTDEDLGLKPTGSLTFAPARRPGTRHRQMPLDNNVLRFPAARPFTGAVPR